MKFEDIIPSILSAKNKYEIENGIETLKVELIAGKKELDWAIFKGYKSDNSCTIFFAWKHKRSEDNTWKWLCPSKNHIRGLHELNWVYWKNEVKNTKTRLSLDEIPQNVPLADFMRGVPNG